MLNLYGQSSPRVRPTQKLAAKTHIINVSIFFSSVNSTPVNNALQRRKKIAQFFHATVYQIIAKCWLIRFAYNLAKRKMRNSFSLQFRFRTIKPIFPFLFAFAFHSFGHSLVAKLFYLVIIFVG